jgi:hypothetical protein
MDQTRMATKIFESKPEVRRNSGKPRLRWMKGGENDLWELKVKKGRQEQITDKNGRLSQWRPWFSEDCRAKEQVNNK